jgi:hypothetical protein
MPFVATIANKGDGSARVGRYRRWAAPQIAGQWWRYVPPRLSIAAEIAASKAWPRSGASILFSDDVSIGSTYSSAESSVHPAHSRMTVAPGSGAYFAKAASISITVPFESVARRRADCLRSSGHSASESAARYKPPKLREGGFAPGWMFCLQ